MEELISRSDFRKVIKIKKIKSDRFADILMDYLKLNSINQVYQDVYAKDINQFIDNALERLQVSYEVSDHDVSKIPKTGPIIIVCNHPYGGIDGLILLRLLNRIRPDLKLMANFLLSEIDPVKSQIIAVNPFGKSLSSKKSFSGMRQTLSHLSSGGALGIFPAGEVSTFHKKQITDKQWDENVMRFIQKSQVPVVPIYFGGSNSLLFHLLGLINPLFRTIKLPSEMLNKQKRTIQVRVGKPIHPRDTLDFKDVNQYGRFIRSKTYALATDIDVRSFFKKSLNRKSAIEIIVPQQDPELLKQEITSLPAKNLLFTTGDYSVYCAETSLIPIAIKEIGRLREITYRAVGEGTNNSSDLDEFDLYFHQLIIYDKSANKIVGGYRIGKGADIMHLYGIEGFYINQLFKLSPKFFPELKESLELGRSFITQEYQRKPLPLFLLWKGILAFLLKHPEYRYLIGPVSISNHFSGVSRRLLIAFLKANYFDSEIADLVKPRKAFKVKSKRPEEKVLLEASAEDLNKLDRIIQDIEPMGMSMPVLFKKYLKQNAKVIGFNIDPLFNDALDGLMLLDIYDVPEKTILQLMGELQDEELNKALVKRNLVA